MNLKHDFTSKNGTFSFICQLQLPPGHIAWSYRDFPTLLTLHGRLSITGTRSLLPLSHPCSFTKLHALENRINGGMRIIGGGEWKWLDIKIIGGVRTIGGVFAGIENNRFLS